VGRGVEPKIQTTTESKSAQEFTTNQQVVLRNVMEHAIIKKNP
jgi:hypothetical protein